MNDNAGRVGATAVGIIVIVVVFLLILRPGAKTRPVRLPNGNRPVAGERHYSGQQDRTLGQIIVPVTSTVLFDCPQCGQYGFAITSTDPASPADGLNDAAPSGGSAQFTVSPGTYSQVSVVSHGEPWRMTIVPEQG